MLGLCHGGATVPHPLFLLTLGYEDRKQTNITTRLAFILILSPLPAPSSTCPAASPSAPQVSPSPASYEGRSPHGLVLTRGHRKQKTQPPTPSETGSSNLHVTETCSTISTAESAAFQGTSAKDDVDHFTKQLNPKQQTNNSSISR